MPQAPSAHAIEIRNVSKRFGAVQALDDVSFTVKPGELFFLLGPSGCGKSTLLRILAGLETPDAGSILFDGIDIVDLPPHQRGAPMVFQNYALWPHLSVFENVAFGLVERRVPRSDARTRVLGALQKVDLQGLEGRMPGQLSGGQQQRVVLARALVLNPNIVLLDEPLSNLDAKLRLEMRGEIERLHASTDITFVYVTHDQAEALSLADRLVVLDRGRIRAAGAPGELYHRPPNAFCADFLGEANLVPAKVLALDGGHARIQTAMGTWMAVVPAGMKATAGLDALAMIRPENLYPSDRGKGNRIEGLVRSSRMNGSTMTVTVEAGGMVLRVTVLNGPGVTFYPGQVQGWEASTANTILVAREAAEVP